MHGARHGFRDSGARLASSPPAPPPSPPAFYYYWANITQALLIIHQHLSAKSHAEETRHPAAWKEIKATSLRCIVSLVLSVQNELWALITNCLHEDGVFKKRCHHPCKYGTITPVRLAPIIDRVPPFYEVLIVSRTLSKKCHCFHALMRKAKLQQPCARKCLNEPRHAWISPAVGSGAHHQLSVFMAGIKKRRLKQAAMLSLNRQQTLDVFTKCKVTRMCACETTNRASQRYKYRYEERGTLIF